MSFEQDIIKTPQDRIDFEALCKSTFNCPSGRALHFAFCQARPDGSNAWGALTITGQLRSRGGSVALRLRRIFSA